MGRGTDPERGLLGASPHSQQRHYRASRQSAQILDTCRNTVYFCAFPYPSLPSEKETKAQDMGLVELLNKVFPHKDPDPHRGLGRNELCWCGSGKKYKGCHLQADEKKRGSGRK